MELTANYEQGTRMLLLNIVEMGSILLRKPGRSNFPARSYRLFRPLHDPSSSNRVWPYATSSAAQETLSFPRYLETRYSRGIGRQSCVIRVLASDDRSAVTSAILLGVYFAGFCCIGRELAAKTRPGKTSKHLKAMRRVRRVSPE